jgi:ABC-type dipeptide/oligopeptide/nickel transport system permease subunit
MSTMSPEVGAPHVAERRRLRLLGKRFLRRPMAMGGLIVVSGFVVMAIFAPLLAPYPASYTDFNAVLAHSSPKHLLGTDDLGHDVLSRLIWGARVSMLVGVLSTLLGMTIAVPIGMLAGYYRGWVDTVIIRITDVLLAFPFLILAVGLAAILGPSLQNATLALGISTIPGFIRIARGETLALREEDYVPAAVLNGANDATIIFRHILPNMTNTLLVQATLTIPGAIVGEAILSFLGLSVQPPQVSWGTMLSEAEPYLTQAPRLAIYPGIAIMLAALAFNVLGDGLRDVLDPKTSH